MVEQQGGARVHASSTGQAGTSVAHLDIRFEANRPEYEAMLRSVGILSGWRVLDAGCGSGSYLPLLGELVGDGGAIAALDLAPDNIATVRERLAGWRLPCSVDARAGSLADPLPYPDGCFDAVWCSSTTEYLTDDELTRALAEFRRVVRPGGLVALKDIALEHSLLYPRDQAVWWRLLDSARRVDPHWHGMQRTHALRRWMERAGLVDVWQRTTLIERWAPLSSADQALRSQPIHWYADTARLAGVSDEDQAYWEAQREPASPDRPQNHPDFYSCEGHYVAVGRVPG